MMCGQNGRPKRWELLEFDLTAGALRNRKPLAVPTAHSASMTMIFAGPDKR